MTDVAGLLGFEDTSLFTWRRAINIKRFRIRYIAASVVALAGVCLLLYPKVNNLIYQNKVATQKDAFCKKMQEMSFPAGSGPDNYNDDNSDYFLMQHPYDDLFQFLKAENERLYVTGQDDLSDVFSYETAGIDLSCYGLDDGCVGFLEAPSIGVVLPIFLGANTENMKKGAVHMTQTSYPIGGKNTNAVIAAHRGGTCEMLRNIHQIQLGDEIIITNFKERLTYQAIEVRIILPTDVGDVKIQEGRDLITLLSCNPLGKNHQRYVLYCERTMG